MPFFRFCESISQELKHFAQPTYTRWRTSTVPVIELELNVSLQSGTDRASSHIVRQLLCEMKADQVAVDILAAVLKDLLRARNHANDVVIVQVRRALPAPDVVLVCIGDNFNLQITSFFHFK